MTISKNYQKHHDSVDYQHVYNVSNEFLAISHSINGFPFKVKKFIQEQSDIKLCSFIKTFQYGVDVKSLGSESAIIIEQSGKCIIFCNQAEPKYRVRFSIMHEFGHYILGHISDLPKTDPLYQRQELEANYFAAQILMPEQILRECIKREKRLTTNFIQKSFDVSKEAAEKRIQTLRKSWNSIKDQNFDDVILLKYEDFVNQVAPKNFSRYDDFEHELEVQTKQDSWSFFRNGR
ncbi:MAG: ImmA/IrrE family metallo-endopeptidase [Selenomonadaceae bacterium]|nr:ImmA/IrrE family metallo-endopeptidase [Selenomonadaceae bacterium]